MVRYYTLISVFGTQPSSSVPVSNSRVEIKLIDVSLFNVAREMKKLAIDSVCNEIGKNNFVNTLEGEYADTPSEQCPAGFVLKYGKDYGHGQINVLFNKPAGMFSSSNVSTLVGYFAVLPAEKTSKIVEKDFSDVVSELKARANAVPAYDALTESYIPLDEEEEDDNDYEESSSEEDSDDEPQDSDSPHDSLMKQIRTNKTTPKA